MNNFKFHHWAVGMRDGGEPAKMKNQKTQMQSAVLISKSTNKMVKTIPHGNQDAFPKTFMLIKCHVAFVRIVERFVFV